MDIQGLPQDKDTFSYHWLQRKDKVSSVIEDALKQSALYGLTPLGFVGSKDVPNAADFDFERVFLVWDAAEWCFNATSLSSRPETSEFNKEYNSLVLCGLIEQIISLETWGRISGITYGELILGMFLAGYRIKRLPRSKVCQFNVSEKNIKELFTRIEIRMKSSLSHRERCGTAAALS